MDKGLAKCSRTVHEFVRFGDTAENISYSSRNLAYSISQISRRKPKVQNGPPSKELIISTVSNVLEKVLRIPLFEPGNCKK